MGESLQSQKSLACSFVGCEASFRKPWKLEAHLCKHTGVKPFSCGKCDKSFCTSHQLTRHGLSHSEEKPHQCRADGCSEAFATNGSLKNHTARVHERQEKQYQCDIPGCGKNFNKKNRLKAHGCEQHQQPLPFHCTFSGCTKEFPTHRKRMHHEKVHGGYPCHAEDCPFEGKTWTDYQNHRKQHEVKVPCGVCNKLFVTTWHLQQHARRRHSVQPKRTLACPRDGCDKTFTRRFNVESHVLGDHEGAKPFSCAHAGCGRSFAMKESLRRHGVAHDPARRKLKALHPKKPGPQRMAQRVTAAAAANQEDTDKLVGRLDNVVL